MVFFQPYFGLFNVIFMDILMTKATNYIVIFFLYGENSGRSKRGNLCAEIGYGLWLYIDYILDLLWGEDVGESPH